MAGNAITFTKSMKDHAKANRKGLFAWGFSDLHLKPSEGGKFGQAFFHTPMDSTKAIGLLWFVFKVHHGMTPEEAFAAIDWETGKMRPEVLEADAAKGGAS